MGPVYSIRSGRDDPRGCYAGSGESLAAWAGGIYRSCAGEECRPLAQPRPSAPSVSTSAHHQITDRRARASVYRQIRDPAQRNAECVLMTQMRSSAFLLIRRKMRFGASRRWSRCRPNADIGAPVCNAIYLRDPGELPGRFSVPQRTWTTRAFCCAWPSWSTYDPTPNLTQAGR